MADTTNVCEVKPVTAFLSTNLNNRNKTYKDLSERILRQLGYPVNSIELHRDQIYDAISIAVELFTKYCTDTEILVFDSKIYERDKGVRIDKLCTLASKKAAIDNNVRPENLFKKQYDKTITVPERTYTAIHDIPQEELPSSWDKPIKNLEVITKEQFDEITTYNTALCSMFKISRKKDFSVEGELIDQPIEQYENAFDYDLMDYRKVVEVMDYTESSNRNWTSLFSFESALAAQAYFNYQLQGRGFDLLSFHTLQEFLKTRNRVLALNRSWYFDPYTQMFTLLPQPKLEDQFYAILTVAIERPLRNVLNEYWIFRYATEMCKLMLGTIRGRFGSVQMAGGGTLADNLNLRSTAEQNLKELEKELIEGTAYSSKNLPMFYVG